MVESMKRHSLFAVMSITVIGVSLLGLSLGNFSFISPAKAEATLPNFADLVEKLSPAVVNISTTSILSKSPVDEFFSGQVPPEFEQLFKELFKNTLPYGDKKKSSPQEIKSLGSGFVIDKSGYIVTNNHVVTNADKIEVNFPDGSSYPAKVIGTDPKTDLALLKIKAGRDIPSVNWGNSDESRVGEWVLAIGNPYGLSGSVSTGIISAVNRNIEAGPYDNFIQTDAAINRGNSGGPLFDIKGNVIGVNSAIISPSGGSVGVGFAIPSSLAQNVISQLKTKGTVERGWIGVNIQPITQDIADSLNLDSTSGALIGDVSQDSPAQKAGLIAGDVIISVNDKKVLKPHDLPRMIADIPVGKQAELGLIRQGDIKKTTITVGKYDDKIVENTEITPTGAVNIKELGIAVRDMDRTTKKIYGIPLTATGILIESVKNSRFSDLQNGDIIAEIQQKPIQNIKDFVQEFSQLRKKGQNPILFKMNRRGSIFYLAVRF